MRSLNTHVLLCDGHNNQDLREIESLVNWAHFQPQVGCCFLLNTIILVVEEWN